MEKNPPSAKEKKKVSGVTDERWRGKLRVGSRQRGIWDGDVKKKSGEFHKCFPRCVEKGAAYMERKRRRRPEEERGRTRTENLLLPRSIRL